MEENLSLFSESWKYRGRSSAILAQLCHPENSSVILSVPCVILSKAKDLHLSCFVARSMTNEDEKVKKGASGSRKEILLLVRAEGIEPSARRLKVVCSTTELRPQGWL